jgi:hypothetical protein
MLADPNPHKLQALEMCSELSQAETDRPRLQSLPQVGMSPPCLIYLSM